MSPYRKAHLRQSSLPDNFPDIDRSRTTSDELGNESMPKEFSMSLSIEIEDMTKLTDDEYLEMKSCAKSTESDSDSNATPSRM